MARRSEHFDSADSVFFARELQQTLAEQFNVIYTERKARSLVGTGELIHPGVKTVRREIYDGKGTAKRIEQPGDDLPQVTLSAGEDFATMYSYGLGCSWDDQEIRTAQLTGKSLERMRMDIVRKGLADALDDHISVGDTGIGNLGLLNQTACNDVTGDITGAWLTDATSAETILSDLHTIVNKCAAVTNDAIKSTRLVLPTLLHRKLSARARSTTSDTTILEYFKRNRPDVEVLDWERSNTVGASDKHRVMAYNPSTSYVRLLLSYDFQADPPERKNRSQKVNCYLRDGGIWLLSPKTLTYGDTI